MRKFSRRSTIFLVALGVLLTASIAFAAVVAVSGSDNFTIATADDTTQNPPQPLVVDINRRPNNGTGPISEDDVARYRIDITNPNGYPVDLGEDPVEFSLAGGDADCTLDDLDIRPPDLLQDVTIPANGSVYDHFNVRLDEGSGPQCDNLTLTITVTMTGEGDDGTPTPTPIEGEAQV